MAGMESGNPSKENLDQIHHDTQRDAQVEPGPGRTTNESDMKAAEGLQSDPKVASEYEQALDRGATQEGEGRVLDR
ncbi:MAG TPA: hypothetical protein VHL09_12375 [Dehalococcoidia bacterium]|nr:hypothetical protein [Dehalococcoidia bacterium]